MKKAIIAAPLATMLMVGAAAAQTSTQTSSSTMGSNAATKPNAAAQMNVRQRIQDELGKDGLTNVTVMPSSFFVRATNKQGQPVAMVISPDSVFEVTDLSGNGGSQANEQSGTSKPNTSTQK